MTHRSCLPAFLLAAILAVGPDSSGEENEIHECTDAQGNVTYQDDPCPEVGTGVEPPKGKTPPAPSPAKPKPKPVPLPLPAPSARLPRPARPAPPTHPVDPRHASPERTWQTFVAAMKDGDRAAALACLTSAALEKLGPLIESLPPERLRETVDALGNVESDGEVGPFWALRAARPAGPPKWIFLERSSGGGWKIAAI